MLYMVPFGIALAATVRVGQAVGRRDAVGHAPRRLRRHRRWPSAFMAAMTLIVALTRHAIPLVFLGTEAPQSAETMALAATLLVLGASFFITDGVQTVAGGALRGLNDTRVPLLFSAVELLGGRLRQLLLAGVSRWGSAPSACGSACRSAPPSTPACWCGASMRSRRGTTCRRLPGG